MTMHNVSRCDTPSLRALHIGMWWQTTNSGGLDRVYADLCRFLPGAGVETTGIVEGPSNVATMTGGRIQTYAPHQASGVERLLAIRRAISTTLVAQPVDVIAAHFSLYAATALDQIAKQPFVMHFHGPWAAEAAEEGASRVTVGMKSLIERTVYGRATRVIVLSNAFGKLVSANYGVPEDRIRVVPGSVDLQRFDIDASRAQARARLGWPSDRPILLAVRRLTPRMGLDRLIAAIPVIRRGIPDVLLYVAGTGRLRPELERRVAELNLDAHVRFLGFLPDDDLPFAYRAADLNVVPTASLEGFGLVAAEALAAGTPSVVTPIGGLPEVVEGLSSALVCADASAQAIATAITDLLRGTRLLPDEDACRGYARSHFTSERAALGVARVYRELI